MNEWRKYFKAVLARAEADPNFRPHLCPNVTTQEAEGAVVEMPCPICQQEADDASEEIV